MRTLALIIVGTIFLGSCINNDAFNITSTDIDVDTLEIKLKYDSFENEIRENLLARMDTSSLWKSMDSLTDSSFMADWIKETTGLGIEQFSDAYEEMSRPYLVNNLQEEVIHFTILKDDYFEVEISPNQFKLSKNRGKIEVKKSSSKLWQKVKSECKCEVKDNIPYILTTIEGDNLYRLDLVLDGKYIFCWKVLTEQDILNQLIEETIK